MDTAQNTELNLIELLKVLGRYRYVVWGSTVLVLALGIAYAFLTTPMYRAEVTIAAAEDSASGASSMSSLFSRIGALPGMGALSRLNQRSQTTQGIATLSSQRFIMEYIDEKNLLPVLFAGKWDAENEQWKELSEDEIPTLSDGYLLFKNKILSIVEEDNGLVTVSVEWRDPVQAAEWVNELVARINERLRKGTIEEANRTINFLNQEAEKTRIIELRQAIYFMIEGQINQRTLANVREEFAFKVISPAVAPEDDQFVSPNRPLIFVVSFLLGPVVGVFCSFLIVGIIRLRAELADGQTAA